MAKLTISDSIFLVFLFLLCGANSQFDVEVNTGTEREKRLLSLFSVVRFRNSPCRSNSALSKGTTGFRNGTCFTAAECSEGGGTAAGTCASSFGVCCVFSITATGSSASRNCTYIRNPGFPSQLASTTAIQYTIRKCQCDVCYLRLDFECFTLLGVGNTLEPNGGLCQDTFTVTATNTGLTIPTICGQNTGQHVYIDMGRACSDSVTLNFNFMGTSTTRLWELKASQIPCSSTFTPPNGCLQYHTTLQGRLTSFNFIPTNDNHLQNQQYSICVRQGANICCIQYQVCPDVNNGMSLSSIAGPNGAIAASAMQDSSCTLDYVGISGSSATCNTGNTGVFNNKYCGPFLNTFSTGVQNIAICDCTPPFMVDIRTDALTDEAGGTNPNTARSRGICLDYNQIPC